MKLFFARDPGAANVIGELFAKAEGPKVLVAKDFAQKVFTKRALPFLSFNENFADKNLEPSDTFIIEKFLDKISPTKVITGTTHRDDFSDRLIWDACAQRGIPSAAVIDQWLRIPERFQVMGKTYRPDIVFCPNEDIRVQVESATLARQSAQIIGHPHLARLYQEKKSISQIEKESFRKKVSSWAKRPFKNLILFASEPQTRLSSQGAQFTEVQRNEFDYFKVLKSAVFDTWGEEALLVVKLHPKEDPELFKTIHPYIVPIDWDPFMLMSACDVVVGIKSMLLVEAVLLGAQVISMDFENIAAERLITNELGLSARVSQPNEVTAALRAPPPTLNRALALNKLGIDSHLSKDFYKWLTNEKERMDN